MEGGPPSYPTRGTGRQASVLSLSCWWMVGYGVCSTFFAKVRYGKRDDRDVFAAGNKIRLYKVGGPTTPSLPHSLGRKA